MKIFHYFFEISMTILQIVFICMKVAGNGISWNLALIPFYILLAESAIALLSQIVVVGTVLVIHHLIEDGMIETSLKIGRLNKK